MEAEEPPDVSTELHTLEQETKEEVGTPTDFSTKLCSEEKETKEAKTIVDTTQPLSKEQQRKEENEVPADASEPHSTELEGKSKAAEISNELQAPQKKTRKVLKPRSKIAKQAPASNSLNKKKAKVTIAELEGEEEIKNKGVLLIHGGNSSKKVDTTVALCMEHEIEEGTDSTADVSTEPVSMEMENKKVAETSNELLAQPKTEEKIQAAPDVSTEPHSVELKNKSESARTCEKVQASTKRTVKVLKARSKIAKNCPAIASSMKKKVKATIPKVEVKKVMKEKDVSSVKKGNSSGEDFLKQSTSGDERQQNADNFRSEEKDNRNWKGKNSCSHVEKNANELAADHSEEKRAEVLGKSKRKSKETEKQKSNESLNSWKDIQNPDNLEKKPRKEQKEKLGGLIFMCNSKTKPDCLRYGVMGVTLNKKDLVLGIRPGLELFLYDYDLKLMHGIYKATSSGGMRLEPRAFDGAFPVQVRFKVHLDCYPLPESIFRLGIKENFTTKHKFKTELSTKQAKRLAALFQPIELHPKELPARSPRLTESRMGDSYVRAQESRHLSRRETSARDPYADHQSRRLPVLAHERDRLVVDRELAPRRTAEPREMYLTEREYRTFGLRGERRNSDQTRRISPTLRPYREDNDEREHHRRLPEKIHREAAPARREYAVGRSYRSDREYRSYSLHTRQELHCQVPPSRASTSAVAAGFDSYREGTYDAYRHGAASVDPYARPSRREDISSGSFAIGGRRESYFSEKDRLRRREVNRDESRPKYIDDLMGRHRARRNGINENNAASLPVSSRYSFAGPRI
ncbi:hypothetical protein BT93_H2980 [Corymbia citriodora subsp. variegata]|nr:hypothetical protein BT93_H2980 [Corymbia citriodora subsp. variegata]KAF8017930.1 hypothetical protein BT93_H2980 [Corymbia citriodora subsp. variegata]